MLVLVVIYSYFIGIDFNINFTSQWIGGGGGEVTYVRRGVFIFMIGV